MLPAATIHYDTLILALGSQVNDFGAPGVPEHCHFIDDIGEASALNDLLRSRVVLAANAGEDLDVVIVGGGATGVELAAELTLDGDRRIEAGLVVRAAGVKGPAVMSNLDGVEISRRGQALVADTLQTKTDAHIFALVDCSDLAGADGKRLPSTAQVRWQQALFLAKSLARHIKNGAPSGHFKYRDRGSLVSLGEYAAYGTHGPYEFMMGDAFEGCLTHMGHAALYRMHQLDINGPARGAMIWLAATLRRSVQPRVRTS